VRNTQLWGLRKVIVFGLVIPVPVVGSIGKVDKPVPESLQ